MTYLPYRLWIILWITLVYPALLTAQTIPLLSQSELAPYALKQVWFHQLKLRPVDGSVQHILLEGGQLFLTTSDARLHVLDAETGEWLWTRSAGKREYPLTEPAVNSRVVAVHNNQGIFLFNRKNGKQLLQIPLLPEAAAAACEMSEHYLYIPMVNQTLLGFVIRESFAPQPEFADDSANSVESRTAINDPELAKYVKQFADAKRSLRAADPAEPDDDHFVLDSTHRIPITCAAQGTLRTKPVLLSQFYTWKLDEEENPTHEVDSKTHREFVSWVTEQGFLFTGKIEALSDSILEPLYRVDSAGQTFYMNQQRTVQIDRPGNKSLPVRPTQSQLYPVNDPGYDNLIVPDVVVTGGRAAYLFAIDARTGDVRWQFPTQGQLLETIAIIGRDVYAPTANGGLHALDLISGQERWFTRNVKRFVAASRERIYVLDMRSRLVCLDRRTGATLFVYDVRRFDHCLLNMETDQIFLITNGGFIQCLRERQFVEGNEVSLRHRISSAEFAEAVKTGEMPKLWWLEETENE